MVHQKTCCCTNNIGWLNQVSQKDLGKFVYYLAIGRELRSYGYGQYSMGGSYSNIPYCKYYIIYIILYYIILYYIILYCSIFQSIVIPYHIFPTTWGSNELLRVSQAMIASERPPTGVRIAIQ